MDSDQIRRCEMRIADEERLANEAAYPEAAELHRQLASLYKAQIAVAQHDWRGIAEVQSRPYHG